MISALLCGHLCSSHWQSLELHTDPNAGTDGIRLTEKTSPFVFECLPFYGSWLHCSFAIFAWIAIYHDTASIGYLIYRDNQIMPEIGKASNYANRNLLIHRYLFIIVRHYSDPGAPTVLDKVVVKAGSLPHLPQSVPQPDRKREFGRFSWRGWQGCSWRR